MTSTYVFKAVMSTTTQFALTRLDLPEGKPLRNVLGQQILADASDLFQGVPLQAPDPGRNRHAATTERAGVDGNNCERVSLE
jgi:hypothetical protein